jgi:hypothetical protein
LHRRIVGGGSRSNSADARKELLQTADESQTPDERLKFIARFVAEKIAGAVASEAIKKANLPEDRDLYLDLWARLYLVLVPMRMFEDGGE